MDGFLLLWKPPPNPNFYTKYRPDPRPTPFYGMDVVSMVRETANVVTMVRMVRARRVTIAITEKALNVGDQNRVLGALRGMAVRVDPD